MFCPSCGTANRDEAEMCTECGNVIPRLTDSTSQPAESTSPSPYDFGLTEQPAESQFGIDVGYPPPPLLLLLKTLNLLLILLDILLMIIETHNPSEEKQSVNVVELFYELTTNSVQDAECQILLQ
ncbi:MAG: zinc ribbon domain-containing protein [Candidatus Heimdallarchaeota archaeon]|nr:zinc ribbon domain-containing protein [Candidatus Heimdallarchaeota archaeon]